jgi:hypothetical protein
VDREKFSFSTSNIMTKFLAHKPVPEYLHLWIQSSCILHFTHERQLCKISTEIHNTRRYLFASYSRRIDKVLLPFCILLFTFI